jgi:uncharacterized protein YkwD
LRSARGTIAGLLALLVLALTASPAAAAASPDEQAMIEAINSARAQSGLPALRPSAALGRSAHAYSRQLMSRGVLAHGLSAAASRTTWHIGEALALRRGRRAQVSATVRAWLRSPTHRRLLLNRSMPWLGVGMARGRYHGGPGVIWVLRLGRRGAGR